ncbi:MAG TPA: glycosyltransferase family 8 protein [Planctomycetaceae bacterium]|nr:glycosyltransferase family 8 protein [Planctomycetaceae bacterium]HQZ68048.1 glycosyltransferase family 8 protein [Planctomycetaceae bacterium]
MTGKKTVACATLVTTPAYVIGAQVLGHSVRKSGWKHEMVAMVTSQIGNPDREKLSRIWDRIVEVGPISNPNSVQNQALANFPTTYTKLRIWEQTDYEKVIFIDADAVVLGDFTDLLQRPSFAAAPCMTAPDCFNTGVLVVEPSQEMFVDLMARRQECYSYDGSDQGFLNGYFPDWFTGDAARRLPLTYNVPWFLSFYRAGWDRAKSDIRILHYCGPQKPWDQRSEWQMKVLYRLIRVFTSLKLADPRPQTYWTEMHHDLLTSLRNQ